jgi:uncharacterized protein YdeI (BOF family)
LGSVVEKKEVAKYSAVFGAGVLSVLAAIGFTSLIQPQAVAPVANQIPILENTPEAADPQGETSEAATSGPVSQKPQSPKQTRNSSAANESAAESSLGAGTVVDGVTMVRDLVRNTMVTVEGTVTRASEEDEFIITDSTGSVQVYTGRTFFTVEQGQVVSVRGLVDDSSYLEIYADEIVLPDGSIIQVRHWR